MSDRPGPRPHVLLEANYRQLLDQRPNVAILPWGATEAHGWHLPHGTDVLEATGIAEEAAALAAARGARPLVLPAIPFGNNAQQQDQVATIHLSTATAAALLADVTRSLVRQGIDRLVVLNGHGGNDFKPLIRDVMLETGALVVLVNFFGVRPDLVVMAQAGDGRRLPWALGSLGQPGVWTPRPWSHTHPDTGAGSPAAATAAKGAAYFAAVTEAIAGMLVELSAARRGDVPYV
jgi:creatinine amidohydrolase